MWRLSAQKRGGRETWIRRVRTTSFVVRIISREEEGTGGGVIELPPVVTLDGLNSEAELSRHPGKEVEESGEGLRLGAQRESPRVMRKIINNDQIICIARYAEYRRYPLVTVNQIKSMPACEEEEENGSLT